MLKFLQTNYRKAISFAPVFIFILRFWYVICPQSHKIRYMRFYEYETRGLQMGVWMFASEKGKFQLTQRTFSGVETHLAVDY